MKMHARLFSPIVVATFVFSMSPVVVLGEASSGGGGPCFLATPPAFTVSLSRGSRGYNVSRLQEFLWAYQTRNELFRSVLPEKKEDFVIGIFGPRTAQAVGLLQEERGIVKKNEPGYGTVGPRTRNAIGAGCLAPVVTPPIPPLPPTPPVTPTPPVVNQTPTTSPSTPATPPVTVTPSEPVVTTPALNLGQNILANGDFELGQNDWTPPWDADKAVSTTTHSGVGALQLKRTPWRDLLLEHGYVGVSPDTQYRISFYVKATNMSNGEAYMSLLWKTSQKKLVEEDIIGRVGSSTDWVFRNAIIKPPLTATRLYARFQTTAGTGNVYIDDVAVQQVLP